MLFWERLLEHITPSILCTLRSYSISLYLQILTMQKILSASLSNAIHMSLMQFHISTSDQNKTLKIVKDKNTSGGVQPTMVWTLCLWACLMHAILGKPLITSGGTNIGLWSTNSSNSFVHWSKLRPIGSWTALDAMSRCPTPQAMSEYAVLCRLKTELLCASREQCRI